MKMNLNAILKASAKKYPNGICVIHEGNRFTYSEIDRSSDTAAFELLRSELKAGDRVAILLENSCEYIIAFFGVLKASGVAVPLNTHLLPAELSYFLKDSSPRFIITDARHKASLAGIVSKDHTVLLVEEIVARQGRSGCNINCAANPGDLAMIIYTSGATGKPKGVMLSHGNLVTNANSIIRYLKIRQSDRMMVVLPFYYSYGTSLLTTHVKAGAILVIDNRFLYPNVILDTMEKEKVTGFAGVPSNFMILLRKSSLRQYKLNSLRYVTQAGGALAPAIIKEFTVLLPKIKFYVMYGQTEATARLTYLDHRFLNKRSGSIGKATPGVKIDIMNDKSEKNKPGVVGEIVASGKNVMLGYWNAPGETGSVMKKGRLWTGDLGYTDKDGFIYLVARKKEMIKSGAHRISPLEIEDVVSALKGVKECAAVGVPDEILGEAIRLFVAKNGEDLSENDIMLFCKNNLAPFKIPREIKLIPSLPRTPTGKIKRLELLNLRE
jgi:acyl-CoA synthetase (AMP-forming)/AMP-acid ligase II